MAKEDFLSFEDVMKELQVSENDLQRMISDMKMSAIRSKGTLIFRRKDVQQLKDRRDAESAIRAPGGQAPAVDAADAPTLLEVAPSGDTQELRAVSPIKKTGEHLALGQQPFGIAQAPDTTEEDEIGTELNFEAVPLGDTQELPSADPKKQAKPPAAGKAPAARKPAAAGKPPAAASPSALNRTPAPDDKTDTVIPSIELSSEQSEKQDEVGTDLNLDGFNLDEPKADDVSDTVIPTIELSSDDEEHDDTTDTVIPTIELSADEDLTDDTSDTVIPTIELGPGGAAGGEGQETQFPTIELGEGGEKSGGTADISFDQLGETSQETQDLGLATESGEMAFAETQTEEDIPTFEEAPAVDTQQETSAVASQMAFAPTSDASGAETAPIGGGPEADVGGGAVVSAPPISIGFGSVVLLFLTLMVCVISAAVLASAVSLGASGEFQTPGYLTWLTDFVSQNVLRKPF